MKRSKKKIAFAGPWITKKEVAYTKDATLHGFYETYDTYIKKLEAAMAKLVGVGYAIATPNCTGALHMGAYSLGLGPGDEVILPDFSWVATAHAISHTGATPVFVDIEPETWCIDPASIEKAITKRTKAIMVVDTFGQPAQWDEIRRIAKKYNLKIIEDSAPALGSTFKGKMAGSFGDVAGISFHGAKIVVGGEGGMFLTNNKTYYEKARLFSRQGRTDRKGAWWIDIRGHKYMMANIVAALVLGQVERIDELVEKKRQIHKWYSEGFADDPRIFLITELKGRRSNYCYPSLLVRGISKKRRDEILVKLEKLNIHARAAFARMSQFPIHEVRYENPESKRAEDQGISLPSAANLTKKDIQFVCEALTSLL